jgi:hypothetical protein
VYTPSGKPIDIDMVKLRAPPLRQDLGIFLGIIFKGKVAL